jgi:hypothetical protein
VARGDDDDSTLNEDGRVFAVSGDPAVGIELQLVHDSRDPPRWIELITKSSMYWLDADRLCISVFERKTGSQDVVHPFLGARLAGGEEKRREGVSLSNPVPLPGMKAVFQMKGGRYGRTSAIERVILRVRMNNVDADAADGPWNDITKGWTPLPDRPLRGGTFSRRKT